MNLRRFDIDDLKDIVAICQQNSRLEILSMFHRRDPNDKTTVFDFIDGFWFEYVYSNIEKVTRSDLYKGDRTIEYRIAYICTEINLLHRLPNGNKRSSLLVLWILMFLNCEDKITRLDPDKLYNLAKVIAKEGTQQRQQNIKRLQEYITNL